VFQASLSTAPLPLGSSSISSGGSKVPLPIIRDKKSGNSYSAAGDDDINDVAAMGGVNLQEEANVSNLETLNCWWRYATLFDFFVFYRFIVQYEDMSRVLHRLRC
jgi:hypothetical protein